MIKGAFLEPGEITTSFILFFREFWRISCASFFSGYRVIQVFSKDYKNKKCLVSLENILIKAEGNKIIYELKQKNLKALRSKYLTEQKKYTQARINLNYLVNTGISLASEEINILQLQRDVINNFIDYLDLTE